MEKVGGSRKVKGAANESSAGEEKKTGKSHRILGRCGVQEMRAKPGFRRGKHRAKAIGCREQGILPESGDLDNICQRQKVCTSYSPGDTCQNVQSSSIHNSPN